MIERMDPVVEAILEAATHAPSSHNTQPWHFRVKDQTVHLLADRTRALPVNDPDDRELTISCGCALHHLRVAAAGIGYTATLQPLPTPADPDLLAIVELSPNGGISSAEADLDNCIDTRRTYRKRFEPTQIADNILDELAAAAAAEGAGFSVLSLEAQRTDAAALVAEGDAILWHNPSWRRELAAWMHPRRTLDGLTVPWLVAPFEQAVVRSFDMGGGVGARDRQIADESPVLAAILSPGDSPADWLRAGQALSRVLLQACLHGIQASYLNQPIQVPALRPKLQHLIGRPGFPQILLRLGYPIDEIPPTPRRHVRDLIDPLP